MPVIQFKGKTAVESYHRVVPHHTLEIDEKLSEVGKKGGAIKGRKPSLEGNLIVEGDNLIALKSLLPTHAGRIKCIYIDPPYNTGEEGWVYNDNLTQPQFKEWIGQVVGKEGEDATRHDKWCCMMYPRLQILRDFLTEDGVLFLSIGEDELHHLRMIANEVFRVDKPLVTFVWRRRSASGMRKDPVSPDHEYVLGYAFDSKTVILSGLVVTEDQYPLVENDGRRYASTDLTIGSTAEDRPNQFYPITNNRTGKEYPANPNRVWRFEPSEMARVIKENLVIWPDESEGDMTRPRFKTFFDPENPKTKAVSSWIGGVRTKTDPEAEDYDEDVAEITSGFTAEGGKVLRQIFGKKVFSYPKPVSLLRSLLKVATKNSDLILDSFAGSGTTAHAALALNNEDGGNRRFVLVQQPYDTKDNEKEKFNICEKITAERVRRVSQGYSYKTQKGKTENVAGVGGEFTYARVGPVLMSEYRDLGKKLPTYEQVARYVFFTETSQNFEAKQLNEKTGKIGEWKNTSYYLLYTPNGEEGRALDLDFLKKLKDKNPRKVIYCEKVWVHREDLAQFGDIRPMLVPFNLK